VVLLVLAITISIGNRSTNSISLTNAR